MVETFQGKNCKVNLEPDSDITLVIFKESHGELRFQVGKRIQLSVGKMLKSHCKGAGTER